MVSKLILNKNTKICGATTLGSDSLHGAWPSVRATKAPVSKGSGDSPALVKTACYTIEMNKWAEAKIDSNRCVAMHRFRALK